MTSKHSLTKDVILSALAEIQDPDFNQDIVDLGFIKDILIESNLVQITIELTSNACPVKEDFKRQAKELISSLPEYEDTCKIEIIMTARQSFVFDKDSTLNKVKNVIAIASCKGGVGKSTITALLASELAHQGNKVGILDVDIFGPSMPTLFNTFQDKVKMENQKLIPIEVSVGQNTLKLMSFGFLLGDSPAIMRGPMVSNYVQQLLHQVNWGELDYLFIDMPPGTGDIQLTISQSIRLNASIMVTTRQSLALADVSKGILMFEKVNVPILGLVENMAYFVCDDCDKKHYVFGENKTGLEDKFGLKTLTEIPLTVTQKKDNKTNSDASQSTLWNFAHYQSSSVAKELAEHFARELGKTVANTTPAPEVTFDDTKTTVVWQNQKKVLLHHDLRYQCECAHCVDEYTGEKKITKEDIIKNIAPESTQVLGHYAIAIYWNDGHTSSIYPLKKIFS